MTKYLSGTYETLMFPSHPKEIKRVKKKQNWFFIPHRTNENTGMVEVQKGTYELEFEPVKVRDYVNKSNNRVYAFL